MSQNDTPKWYVRKNILTVCWTSDPNDLRSELKKCRAKWCVKWKHVFIKTQSINDPTFWSSRLTFLKSDLIENCFEIGSPWWQKYNFYWKCGIFDKYVDRYSRSLSVKGTKATEVPRGLSGLVLSHETSMLMFQWRWHHWDLWVGRPICFFLTDPILRFCVPLSNFQKCIYETTTNCQNCEKKAASFPTPWFIRWTSVFQRSYFTERSTNQYVNFQFKTCYCRYRVCWFPLGVDRIYRGMDRFFTVNLLVLGSG